MRVGYNALSYISDFREHLIKSNVGVMVYFDQKEALWAVANLPFAHIIYRDWPDAGAHLRMTPDEFIDKHQHFADSGVIVQTVNESGFNQTIIDWHVKLLQRLVARGSHLRVGLLGLNVGTPKPEELFVAEPLFKLMADMPKGQVFLVLHEYFGGVITSGFIGGDPDNVGAAHGQPGGTNMIPFAKWPAEPQKLTLWHVGRYKFIRDYCAQKGIPCPLFIIGEWGADYLSDIDAWLKSLHSTGGAYDVVDGWRDLTDMWHDWYGLPPIEVYMKMLRYADDKIYDENVVGIAIFAAGYDPNWLKYRVDPEIYPYMEKYAQPPVAIPPVTRPLPALPPPVPQPAPVLVGVWKRAAHSADWKVNVRALPNAKGEKLGTLQQNVQFYWIECPNTDDWVIVLLSNKVVGYALKEVIRFV